MIPRSAQDDKEEWTALALEAKCQPGDLPNPLLGSANEFAVPSHPALA